MHCLEFILALCLKQLINVLLECSRTWSGDLRGGISCGDVNSMPSLSEKALQSLGKRSAFSVKWTLSAISEYTVFKMSFFECGVVCKKWAESPEVDFDNSLKAE